MGGLVFVCFGLKVWAVDANSVVRLLHVVLWLVYYLFNRLFSGCLFVYLCLFRLLLVDFVVNSTFGFGYLVCGVWFCWVLWLNLFSSIGFCLMFILFIRYLRCRVVLLCTWVFGLIGIVCELFWLCLDLVGCGFGFVICLLVWLG